MCVADGRRTLTRKPASIIGSDRITNMSQVQILIEELIRYYETTRGVGHTRTMLQGVTCGRNAVVVVANSQMGGMLMRHYQVDRIVTLHQIKQGSVLRGMQAPLVFDNHALVTLLADMRETLRQAESAVVRANQDATLWRMMAIWYLQQNQMIYAVITAAQESRWNRIKAKAWSFVNRMIPNSLRRLKTKTQK